MGSGTEETSSSSSAKEAPSSPLHYTGTSIQHLTYQPGCVLGGTDHQVQRMASVDRGKWVAALSIVPRLQAAWGHIFISNPRVIL